jgi:hypothetical protein
MGDLLEVAWMGETALRHVGDDATAALLTSMAGQNLLPNENYFEHHILEAMSLHAASLIEETAVQSDLARL